MNAEKARKIHIIKYLLTKGVAPKRETPQSFYFSSPFRRDSRPSFKVDKKQNVWFDYGMNKGGSIIDLVIMLENLSFKDALAQIATLPNTPLIFSFSDSQSIKESTIKIKHIQPLQNRALIQYLKARNISQRKATIYLKEIYYKLNDKEKQFFAVGFENDKNGFAIRNKYFKGATQPNYFTTISGKYNQSLSIFEGFMDFLSALEYYNTDRPKNDCIVLNSTIHLKHVTSLLSKYSTIYSFLDNDTTGKEALKELGKHHTYIINMSEKIYPTHKDFNEYICAFNTKTDHATDHAKNKKA